VETTTDKRRPRFGPWPSWPGTLHRNQGRDRSSPWWPALCSCAHRNHQLQNIGRLIPQNKQRKTAWPVAQKTTATIGPWASLFPFPARATVAPKTTSHRMVSNGHISQGTIRTNRDTFAEPWIASTTVETMTWPAVCNFKSVLDFQ